MIDFLKYRIFSPITSTAKYENSVAVMENNCKTINEILNSAAYNRFIELKKYVESGQCKNDIAIAKNQHIDAGNAAKSLAEYNMLKNSADIKNLPKLQKQCAKYMAEMSQWQGVLGDDFTSVQLDNKWTTKPAAGSLHFNKPYTQSGDLQCVTDGKNINITNSILQIITRHEQADGLLWTDTHGFVSKKFAYTSGMINSATTLAQSGGKIEAKVRMPNTKGTYHAVWLGGEQMLPFINVFCINSGKIQIGAVNNSQNITKKLAIPLKNDFYIVGIEWNESKIIWTINGKKVFSAPIRITEQLHLAFSSGVKEDQQAYCLPISFDIDWVKCYRHK